jgi:hypothetical protein
MTVELGLRIYELKRMLPCLLGIDTLAAKKSSTRCKQMKLHDKYYVKFWPDTELAGWG